MFDQHPLRIVSGVSGKINAKPLRVT